MVLPNLFQDLNLLLTGAITSLDRTRGNNEWRPLLSVSATKIQCLSPTGIRVKVCVEEFKLFFFNNYLPRTLNISKEPSKSTWIVVYYFCCFEKICKFDNWWYYISDESLSKQILWRKFTKSFVSRVYELTGRDFKFLNLSREFLDFSLSMYKFLLFKMLPEIFYVTPVLLVSMDIKYLQHFQWFYQ